MAEQRTYRGGRERLLAELRAIPSVLAGKSSDPGGLVATALRVLGIEAMTIIKDAFVVKSRGGTDEAGIAWPPLKPTTIAYGRRHPGLAAKRTRAAKAGRAGRPLLTVAQDKLWRAIYAGALARGKRQGNKDAGSNAAALAWAIVKARGGKTILGVYGSVQVDQLRDTGRLLNSLSPGTPDSLLSVTPNSVRVGTNVVYAAAHHEGNPAKNRPPRPLWPEPDKWPQAWTDRLLAILKDHVANLVRDVIARG